MKPTKEYIQENLLTSKGTLNSNKLKHLETTTEELYLIYHGIFKPKCACGKPIAFKSFTKGYINKSCGDKKCRGYSHCSKSRPAKKKQMELTKENIETFLLDKNNKLKSGAVRSYDFSIEEIYLRYHNIAAPLCSCGKNCSFINFPNGYKRTCNNLVCCNNDPIRIKGIKENTDRIALGKKISATKQSRSPEQIAIETEKIKQTKLENHGDENFNNRPKSRQTKLENHGDENYNNSKQSVETRLINNGHHVLYSNYSDYIKDGYFLFKQVQENISISWSHLYKIKKKLSILEPNKRETEYIEERLNKIFGNHFIIRTKEPIKPLELDLYSPKYNFAIEYNGLMWHSHGTSKYSMFNNPIEDKNRHLNKTELCEAKGIQLFHIFENEWLDLSKKDIWISMISGMQGKHQKISASKCEIKEVHRKDAKEFLNQNHLEGYADSDIRIGLLYENELVQLAMFDTSREYEFELIRLASKKNLTIVGGPSRLIEFFEQKFKPKSLVSYVNRRWSKGCEYDELGFEFSHNSEPDYFYFKADSLELKNKDVFGPNLTETQNMFANNYRKIYDCGSKIYVKRF